jgi:hypothetical protein
MRATNATTCKMMRVKMMRATIFTLNRDSAATISIRITLSHAIDRLLPKWFPAFAMPVLWNARPRPVSMNGVNWAAKCALVDST